MDVQFLTARDVSVLLGISENAARRLLARAEHVDGLKSYYFGRSRRWRRAEVLEWAETKKV